jgi:hypothetical protein
VAAAVAAVVDIQWVAAVAQAILLEAQYSLQVVWLWLLEPLETLETLVTVQEVLAEQLRFQITLLMAAQVVAEQMELPQQEAVLEVLLTWEILVVQVIPVLHLQRQPAFHFTLVTTQLVAVVLETAQVLVQESALEVTETEPVVQEDQVLDVAQVAAV